jgi:hypothetical protein
MFSELAVKTEILMSCQEENAPTDKDNWIATPNNAYLMLYSVDQ